MNKQIIEDKCMQILNVERNMDYVLEELKNNTKRGIKILDVILLNAYDRIDDLNSKLVSETNECKIKSINNEIERLDNFINHYITILENAIDMEFNF